MDGVLRDRANICPKMPETGFNPCSNGWCTSSFTFCGAKESVRKVSILVLMDGVLRAIEKEPDYKLFLSFNPCSNGWCTSRQARSFALWASAEVSILVLMDGVLRVFERFGLMIYPDEVSILVLMDGVLRARWQRGYGSTCEMFQSLF